MIQSETDSEAADPGKPDFTGCPPRAYARQSGLPAIEALLRTAGGRE